MRHEGHVFHAHLTKDERFILSWGDEVRLWDAATGKQIGHSVRHGAYLFGARVTKDGKRILSWYNDGSLRLWDVSTGQQIGSPMQHESAEVSDLDALLIGDDRRILSWSDSNASMILWDATTGQQIGPPMKHGAIERIVLLTKDERRILSWARDGTMRLWDTATGQRIGPTMKHEHLAGVLMTKDEQRILSWGGSELRLWDVSWPSGNLLEVACARLPNYDLAVTSKRYSIGLTDPICGTVATPDWSTIERAPAE
jgi:WD40 repeat protein